MTKRIGISLLAVAAISATLAMPDDAQGFFGRRGGGSCGSWGGNSGGCWGSSGSYGGSGSCGSWGGRFRRNSGSCGSYGGYSNCGGDNCGNGNSCSSCSQGDNCDSCGCEVSASEGNNQAEVADRHGEQYEARYHGEQTRETDRAMPAPTLSDAHIDSDRTSIDRAEGTRKDAASQESSERSANDRVPSSGTQQGTDTGANKRQTE